MTPDDGRADGGGAGPSDEDEAAAELEEAFDEEIEFAAEDLEREEAGEKRQIGRASCRERV